MLACYIFECFITNKQKKTIAFYSHRSFQFDSPTYDLTEILVQLNCILIGSSFDAFFLIEVADGLH